MHRRRAVGKYHKEFPDIGMSFKQVKDRISRYDSINRFGHTQIKDSLKNQLRLAEGEASVKELDKELSSNRSSGPQVFSGTGAKQTGFGKGKKLGPGHWRFIDGKWVQV